MTTILVLDIAERNHWKKLVEELQDENILDTQFRVFWIAFCKATGLQGLKYDSEHQLWYQRPYFRFFKQRI